MSTTHYILVRNDASGELAIVKDGTDGFEQDALDHYTDPRWKRDKGFTPIGVAKGNGFTGPSPFKAAERRVVYTVLDTHMEGER